MLYEAERGDMSIAVVGDAMISRRMSPYREPDFLKLVELLRSADLSIANLEFLFHDFEHAWIDPRRRVARSPVLAGSSTPGSGFVASTAARVNHK